MVTYFPLAPLSPSYDLGCRCTNWHRIETEDGGIVIVPAAGSNHHVEFVYTDRLSTRTH